MTSLSPAAEAKYDMSFQKRKPFLKEFASEYLAKKQEAKPAEEALAGEEAPAAEVYSLSICMLSFTSLKGPVGTVCNSVGYKQSCL